ncbi:MAG: hypothetical protein QXE51_03725 [Nitrososphaeria archaeon]
MRKILSEAWPMSPHINLKISLNETQKWALKLGLSLIYVIILAGAGMFIISYTPLLNILVLNSTLVYIVLSIAPAILIIALINNWENRQENKIIRNMALFASLFFASILIPYIQSIYIANSTPALNQSILSHSIYCKNIINSTQYVCENLPTPNLLNFINSDLIVIFSIIILIFQVFETKFVKSDSKIYNIFLVLPFLGIMLVIFSSEALLYSSPIREATMYTDLAIFIASLIFGMALGLLDKDVEKINVNFNIDPNSKQKVFAGKIYPYKLGSTYETGAFYVDEGYKYKLKDIKPKNKNLPDGKLIFHKNYNEKPSRIWMIGDLETSNLNDKQRKYKISQEEYTQGECFDIYFEPKKKVSKPINFTIELNFSVTKLHC